jgi:outer membrane receptor protein involved in Fe transport
MHINLGHTLEKSKESYGQGQFINVEEDILDLRALYQVNWLTDHKLIVGADLKQRTTDYTFDAIIYYCTDHDADCESKKGERSQDQDSLKSKDIALYFNDIWTINERVELELGIRSEKNDYTDQSFTHPRVSLNWYANDDLVIKTKVGTYSRFPDIQTALKKIGNPNLKSPKATHYSMAFEYQVNDLWQSSLEFYYKDIADLARSLDEDDINSDLHYSNDLSGNAHGAEWVVRRDEQDGWYGWASLSWSKSERTDELINQTTEYYLDTPLLANAVANYKLNERWDFGMRLSIRSGAKYTPIVGLHDNPDHQGHYLPTYGELNSKTLPTYHRLDLQANYKTSYWGQNAEWSFALLNALGSDNISGYYFAPDGKETLTDYDIEGEEGMEMFPSIGLKMQF